MRIVSLSLEDRQQWEILARGYREFYKTPTTDAEYESAWQKLLAAEEVFVLGAKVGDELVGIAHFLFHSSVWAPKVCYLQDLYTAPQARGKGVAKALIEAVSIEASGRGATRYYWLTQEQNGTARALYEKIAKYNGFIRYDFAL